MKHLELHIIQSVPVACLNRDDLNSPKTAIFGGVQRARVSSQSWKRAIREMAEKDFDTSGQFKGKRSRLFIAELQKRLRGLGETDDGMINALACCAGHYLAKLDSKKEGKVKTLVFFSPLEYDLLATAVHKVEDNKKKALLDAFTLVDSAKLAQDDEAEEDAEAEEPAKKAKGEKKLTVKKFTQLVSATLSKPIEKAFKGEKKDMKGLRKDAADIAVFGRMVANDHSLTVEAASMFSHALSTHKADNELDFFSAVDDLQPKSEAGAGMTGTLEFNSATYYRFAALNLDMLADEDHLASMTKDERKSVVETFVKAAIMAVPTARKNTMNGNTLPVYVLGVVREKGHPIQLVNAFENPIRLKSHEGGYSAKSVELLKAEYEKLNKTWAVSAVYKQSIPDVSLSTFIEGMVSHVI